MSKFAKKPVVEDAKPAKETKEKIWTNDPELQSSTGVTTPKGKAKQAANASKAEAPAKAEKPTKVAKTSKAEAPVKAEKPAKAAKAEKPAKAEKAPKAARGTNIRPGTEVKPVGASTKAGVLVKALALKSGATMETLIEKLSATGIQMDVAKVKGRINFEARRLGYGVRSEENADPMKTKFFIVFPEGVTEVLYSIKK